LKLLSSYWVLEALSVFFPLLLAGVSTSAQRTVYVGESTTLEVTSVPGHTYKWELYNDASIDFAVLPGNCPVSAAKFVGSNLGPSVRVEWGQPGIYFFKVTAWDATRCAMNLKVGMLKVLPVDLDAVITGATSAGACQQITLDAASSKGDIIEYKWALMDPGGTLSSINDKTTRFGISAAYTGPFPAEFRISLQVTGRNGKSDSEIIRIKVEALPKADIYSPGRPEKDGSIAVDGSVSKGVALTYNWYGTDGKMIGTPNQSGIHLQDAGDYVLRVTDVFGCQSEKTYHFPIEQYQMTANPDYARTSWAHDTIIPVISNDQSTAPLNPASVRILQSPVLGKAKVNRDGTITYTPVERKAGKDQFIYEVCNAVNLCDSALVIVDIDDAKVKIIEGFSPNGDGINDYLVFEGLEQYPRSHLHIYTRSGVLVYQSGDYLNDWDGRDTRRSTINPAKVPTGVYYYVLELGGTSRSIKGFVYIGY